MKKYLYSALIGIVIGTIYPIFIALFTGSSEVIITTSGNGVGVVVLQIILCGLFGPVSLLLSKVTFQNPKLSLLLQTAFHCLGLVGYFIIVGILNKWFINITSIVTAGLVFIVIYASFYFLSYFKIKKEVAEANRALLNKNK